jgi:hypothetical protein
MKNSPIWLPPLILFEDSHGDWDAYVEILYAYFKQDFIDNKPCVQGRRLGLKRYPLTNGKEATFWHMTSEGKDEDDRTPDLRRCERIRWPKPLIENSTDPKVKYWVSTKGQDDRIHIWLEDEDYVVVLADRRGYLLPWTAFMVTWEHTKKKLQKEFEMYWKNQGEKS